MGIAQSGYTGTAGVQATPGAQAAASQPKSTPASANPVLDALSPYLNSLVSGQPVSTAKVPSSGGPNANLVNAAVGGTAYQVAAQQAADAALAQQGVSGQADINLGAQQSQQSANYSLQNNALNSQSLALQGTELAQQAKLNPQLQAIEQGQYNISTNEAQQTLGNNAYQQGLEVQGYDLQNQMAQGDQSNEVQNYGLTNANAQAQQGLEQQNYGLQWDPNNPNSAYSLQSSSNTAQLGNLISNYGYSLPELASGASASGALNSGQNKTNSAQNTSNFLYGVGQNQIQGGLLANSASQAANSQQGEIGNYNTSQSVNANNQNTEVNDYNTNQSLSALGQKGEIGNYNLGQSIGNQNLTSAALGQKGEQANYNYSQQQLQNQQKGLSIAGQQLGLSTSQIQTELTNALTQAGIGGQDLANQIAAQAASGDASTIAAIIQNAQQYAVAATPPATKKKK